MSIEREIARIAASSTDRNVLHDALAALPGAVASIDGLIRCQNLELGVSIPHPSDHEHREELAWARALDISAAPELAAVYPAGAFEVIVRRYWICPGERLIRLRDAKVKFREAARQRFRADMERLFDHGKLYPYIRGDAHWLVSETTGAIVLSPWFLKDASPKEREEYFESIDFRFQRHS